MQFVRYTAGGSPPQWGVVADSTIHTLGSAPGGEPGLDDIGNASYRASVRAGIEAGALHSLPASEASLLAPVPKPGKIVGVGLNYRDHATEQNVEPPDPPQLFSIASTSVTNPHAPIVYPDSVEQLDYEVELGVVIGRHAKHVDAATARDFVAGYTVLNDVSARDVQFADDQHFRGKSFDTFCPMGPSLVAGGDFDPNAADVRLRVDGETKQNSNTDQLIYDVDDLIEFISGVMSLRPGDVIATGTPGGVGIFREPPDLLEPGDVVETEVDGIGTLVNTVVAEGEVAATGHE